MIFLDTSGILAFADADDLHHDQAARMLKRTQQTGEAIVTSNYVLVETAALVHRRLGRDAALAVLREAANMDVVWVTSDIHAEAVARLQQRGPSDLSVVDAVSFVVMRMKGVQSYLGFDGHFETEGFRRASS